jgi:hypothetical protein
MRVTATPMVRAGGRQDLGGERPAPESGDRRAVPLSRTLATVGSIRLEWQREPDPQVCLIGGFHFAVLWGGTNETARRRSRQVYILPVRDDIATPIVYLLRRGREGGDGGGGGSVGAGHGNERRAV